MRREIRVAGVGGQGLVSASIILAEALGVVRHFNVVQTQFYASNITGGASSGDVVMSDEPVDFPWVLTPDFLIALAQDAINAHAARVRSGGIALVDDLLAADISPFDESVTVYKAPITRTADDVGLRKCANIVALGAFARLSGLLDLEQISEAVAHRAPGKVALNRRAVEAGFALPLAPAERRAA